MSRRITFLFVLAPFLLFSQIQRKPLLLFFESNSFKVDSVNAEELTDLLESGVFVKSIAVEGFCDDVGSERYNNGLSQKRAGAVAAYITQNYGLAVARISGKGEIRLASTDSLAAIEERARNRHVAVYIDYSVAEKPELAVNPKKAEQDLYTGYKTIKDSLKSGDKIIFRHLLFQGSRTAFDDPEEAEEELKTIVEFFKNNPNITFEIAGHVCCITNVFWDARDIESGKNNLSETRAKKIYDYFIEKGIAKERMVYKGYGRRFPREGVREGLNKRVEIVITKI